MKRKGDNNNNNDPTMKVVREFEDRAAESGHHSLIKDAVKYAKELDLQGPRSYFESGGLTSDSEWGGGGGLKTAFSQ